MSDLLFPGFPKIAIAMLPKIVYLLRGLCLLVSVSAAVLTCVGATYGQVEKCLQTNLTMQTPVRFLQSTASGGPDSAKAVTVAQELKRLRARCSRGVLKVPSGKRIQFYQLQGCWGNPPADYLEIMDKQRKEIAELKRRFVLVELTCESGGSPRN